ncbi:saccharopine dehydrogenase family protein [Streptosporangium roseum]|uniref:saccharopine dehydrogenase family protein n=1 Tax=Streptosporangium roseum TaxID=2001 RepID=UPI0004CDB296|nr:saccharopine dehydrogenase NADP-binding domain-containing protein [Streptosporangium roseum]
MTDLTGRRVVALGGAGAMGCPAVEALATRRDLAELVIADRDLAAAERLAARLAGTGTASLVPVAVDATDLVGLRGLFRDADLVVNTTGPFFRLGVPVLRAAIDTRTHYADICDDWEPTLDMLALDAEARGAEVTAVIGAGASPGTSNMLAALAVRELESVDDLFTAWPVDVPFVGDDPAENTTADVSAATVHWMQQLSGTIRTWSAGAPAVRPPLEAVTLDYPGLGKGTAYTVGHPEPVTLPTTLSVASDSACVMVVQPATAAYLMALRDDIDRGKLTLEQAAAAIENPAAGSLARSALRRLSLRGPGALPAFFALATGSRHGRPYTVGARLVASPRGMARATGIPLALTAGQILDGTVRDRGVHPPDAVLDPDRYFTELAVHCDPPRSGSGEVVVVDRA